MPKKGKLRKKNGPGATSVRGNSPSPAGNVSFGWFLPKKWAAGLREGSGAGGDGEDEDGEGGDGDDDGDEEDGDEDGWG